MYVKGDIYFSEPGLRWDRDNKEMHHPVMEMAC